MRFEKQGVISYPRCIDFTSIYLGRLRNLYNTELSERRPEYKRGDLEEAVSILGVKCEYIVHIFLFNEKVDFTFADILSFKPVKTADIFIKNSKIDVKGVREDSGRLTVNERSHQKHTDVTHYWFVQPLTNKGDTNFCFANYWIVPYEDVSGWKVEKLKYTNAYCYDLRDWVA